MRTTHALKFPDAITHFPSYGERTLINQGTRGEPITRISPRGNDRKRKTQAKNVAKVVAGWNLVEESLTPQQLFEWPHKNFTRRTNCKTKLNSVRTQSSDLNTAQNGVRNAKRVLKD